MLPGQLQPPQAYHQTRTRLPKKPWKLLGLRDAPLASAPWSALRPLKAGTGSGGYHSQAQPRVTASRQPVCPRWVPRPLHSRPEAPPSSHAATRRLPVPPWGPGQTMPGRQGRSLSQCHAAALGLLCRRPARLLSGVGGAGAMAAPETSLGRDPAHLGSVHRWDFAGQWRGGWEPGPWSGWGWGLGGWTCAKSMPLPQTPHVVSAVGPQPPHTPRRARCRLCPGRPPTASGRGRTRGASCRVPSSAASTHTRPRVACSPRGKSPRLRVKTPPPKNTPRHRHTGVSSKGGRQAPLHKNA